MKTTSLNLRARTVWEAADSGLLLWRENIIPLILFFSCLPVAVVIIGEVIPIRINFVFFFCFLWWLKPLFERFALHVISIRFFDKTTKKLFKGLGKTLISSIAGDLLWRRFSPKRSVIMPIRILESIHGAKLKNRKVALERGGINFGFFLTIICIVLEVVLYVGEILFFKLISSIFNSQSPVFNNDNFWSYSIPYLFNFIIVETLYVCMGFAIYINSRVVVEGWDLQLLFSKGFTK